MPSISKVYTPSNTVRDFIRCKQELPIIMGPVGSGKSVGCLMKIVRACKLQAPGKDGIRRSVWAIVRNTNQQLMDTTLKSWLQWFPDGAAGKWKVSDKTFYLKIGDVEASILFRPLDTAEDLSRLLSLELTSAYLNELRELDPTIYAGIYSRIGRYPAIEDVEPTDPQVIADTNPPNIDSWLYNLMEGISSVSDVVQEEGSTSEVAVFKQPGGMTKEAENLKYLRPNYYQKIMRNPVNSQDFIDVHVHAQYGKSNFGKPVHSRFNRTMHVAPNTLIPDPNTLVIIGMDFGLTPAAVFKQQDGWGRINTFDVLWTERDFLEHFLVYQVLPLIKRKYPTNPILVIGDPSGVALGDKGDTCFSIIEDQGLDALPAEAKDKHTRANDPGIRMGATDHFLMQLAGDGASAAYRIDPGASHLITALQGGYRFGKLRTKEGGFKSAPDKNIFSHVAEANQYGDMFYKNDMTVSYSKLQRRKSRVLDRPLFNVYVPLDAEAGY